MVFAARNSQWRFISIAHIRSVRPPRKRPLNRSPVAPHLHNVCWRILAGRSSSIAARQGHAWSFAELLAISLGELAEVGKAETQCGVGYRGARICMGAQGIVHAVQTLRSEPRHRSATIRTVKCRLQGADGYATGAGHIGCRQRLTKSFSHELHGTSRVHRPCFMRGAQQQF